MSISEKKQTNKLFSVVCTLVSSIILRVDISQSNITKCRKQLYFCVQRFHQRTTVVFHNSSFPLRSPAITKGKITNTLKPLLTKDLPGQATGKFKICQDMVGVSDKKTHSLLKVSHEFDEIQQTSSARTKQMAANKCNGIFLAHWSVQVSQSIITSKVYVIVSFHHTTLYAIVLSYAIITIIKIYSIRIYLNRIYSNLLARL